MPTMLGILTFMGMINVMLSSDEHEISFMTSVPDCSIFHLTMRCLAFISYYIPHCIYFSSKLAIYCEFGNFHKGFSFCEISQMRSFVKTKSLQNEKIPLSLGLTDVGKSYPNCDCLTCQMCLLSLFAKK